MNTTDVLKSVIDKYELSDPVPLNVRQAMEKSRKENLIRILKKDSRRVLFISAVVSFFLWIKKLGISISIVKSAVAVISALVIVIGVLVTASVYTTGKIMDYLQDEAPVIEQVQNSETESVEKPVVQDVLSYAVAVSPVEMDDVSDALLREYTKKMILELRNIKGAQAAIDIDKLDKYHLADKILSISIIKLDEKSQNDSAGSVYRVSAKIISTVNSQVLMYSSVTADAESGIPDSLRKLAEKVSAKL